MYIIVPLNVSMLKNSLQEYCQKNKYNLPIYDTECVNDLLRTWRSTVTLDFCGKSFVGDERSTKKAAEISAAVYALEYLSRPISAPQISRNLYSGVVTIKDKTALLVDVENMPKFIPQLPKFVGPVKIYAFVGKHHPLQSMKYDEKVIVITSPSSHSDGTDTCMQMYVGKFLTEERYDTYLIATRDHFGAALVDLITSNCMEWKPKKASIVTSVSHIIEMVDK